MYTKAMKKTKIIKIIKNIIVFVVVLLALTGCGKENTPDAGVYFHHSIADQTQVDSGTQVTENQDGYVEDENKVAFIVTILEI